MYSGRLHALHQFSYNKDLYRKNKNNYSEVVPKGDKDTVEKRRSYELNGNNMWRRRKILAVQGFQSSIGGVLILCMCILHPWKQAWQKTPSER